MKKDFDNQTVWITGASSGIGEALAYEFAKRGARLVLSARNEKELHRVAAACTGSGHLVQPLDLGDHASLPVVVTSVLAKVGQVHVLVNNGGVSQRSLAKDTNLDVYKKLLDINLIGTIGLTNALLPHFTDKKQGHYVTVTSLMGKFGSRMRTGYAAAKHGLHGFFDSLRAEVWQDNIKVTLVCPGFVNTLVSFNALVGDGKAQGTIDHATGSGMKPAELAVQVVNDVRDGTEEAYYGGKEVLGVYLKRFFPSWLSKILRTAKVT